MYKGKILGGLSLGKKVDWIPSSIKKDTQHDAFLVYTKDAPSSLIKKYYKDFMKDKHVFKNFILADKTIDVSVDEVEHIDFAKKIQDITINKDKYKLFSYPIIDFDKNTMGYLCTLSKLKAFNARFINFTIKELILIFFTIVLLIFINEKKHKKTVKYIHFITNLTDRIKKRDFTFLRTEKSITMNDVGINSLNELEENIIQMGLSLEKQYIYLENDNKIKAEELIAQLYRDELTSLGNRSALLRDLKKFNSSIVALFNIRLFKSINDAFGLEAGNYVLQELAQIYKNISSSELKVYRINADEFAFVSPVHIATNDFIQAVKDTINTIEKTTFSFQKINMRINIYAGICLEEEKKLEKATLALGHAKENNTAYTIYNQNHDVQAIQTNNIEMINKIAGALQNNNIIAYFQPIVDKKGHAHKYEALVRMLDDGKVLSPYHFLEISKKTSMYSEITKIMIEQTFQKFENLDTMFSINLTADDILNEEILQLIDSKLDNLKNPQQAVFELVESDDLYNLPEIEQFLQNIKEKGAKIAIDDFGTGYSNFSYILKIKPDYLKIDGSLIKNLDTDTAAYKTVRTIINFGHDLGICIVAEFIHSQEIFDICLKLGVDEFQGYYFGEPKVDLLT